MVHVTYPSMERQDLTQGQLGSFKFTPVDDTSLHFPSAPLDTFSQQFSDYPHHHHPWTSSQMQPQLFKANATFFNGQIEPNPDGSRLRLGPVAVRAMVESACPSPRNHVRDIAPETSMRPSAESFSPLLANLSKRPEWQSTMYPTSLELQTPGGVKAAQTNAIQSLLCALETEQQAHQQTKNDLKAEIARRQKAEAEINGVIENNKSLLNSIRLLQSTVKHMVKKENQSSEDDERCMEEAVCDFRSKASKANTSDSILYDAVEEQRNRRQRKDNSSDLTGTCCTSFDQSLIDRVPARDASPKAQLQLKQRHDTGSLHRINLSLESIGQFETSLNNQQTVPECKDTLIKPSTNTTVTQGYAETMVSQRQPNESFESLPPKHYSSDTNRLVSGKQQGVLLENGCLFKIPDHVISKYARPGVAKASPSSRIADAVVDCETSMNEAERQHQHLDSFATSEPSELCENIVQMKILSCPDIQWNSSLTSDSNFSRYAVRYVPSMAGKNLFRTVMVDFIPLGSSYEDVLPQVRGGALESIHIYEPIGSATDFLTARVVYTHEYGAKLFYKRGQDPGITIKGNRVRVWRVSEPTYPRAVLQDAIYEQGYTRLLVIDPPDISVMQTLPEKLRSQFDAGFVITIGEALDGMPMVEFTSIEEAWKALDVLMTDEDFGGTHFDFEEDYCETPYT